MSQTSTPSTILHTERVLPFTPERVFAAFEDPAKLARWWGPNGFTSTIERFELAQSGRWVLTLHGPDGTDYPNEYLVKELQPNAKIVVEHVIGHWFQLTVTLTPTGNGTRLTWDQEFPDPETAEQFRPLCEPANEQNLDRLEAVLKGSQA